MNENEIEEFKLKVFNSYYVRSGWMPPPGSRSHSKFIEKIKNKPSLSLPASIAALGEYIELRPTVSWLMDDAFKQNGIILNAPNTPNNEYQTGISIPEIPDLKTLLNLFSQVLDEIPQFLDGDLVGLPFSAITVGIDPTLSGRTVFRLPEFNKHMSKILNEWNAFLGSTESMQGFEKAGWLSPEAKKSYQFDLWATDFDQPPYWNTWNSFFTRQFKDPKKSRPIADPQSNQTVISASDSSLYRWEKQISKEDTFWFKDMPYSLADILSSPLEDQQSIIDQYELVTMFEKGYIFQSYLNPYNYHRWWSPVNGEVLFDPIVIPGDYFNKLVIPDYGGATTESTPYLAQVNARGLVVIETPDFGKVCCIPLGMSEVSTVTFSENVCQGAILQKGDPLGQFNYGGSSFALIFQNLESVELIFEYADGLRLPAQPQGANSSAGSGDYPTNIGSQIGVWKSRL